MAILVNCPVCGRENVNNAYCDGCKLAWCEGILGKLQKSLIEGVPIPGDIENIIRANHWMTVQEHLESRSKAESLKQEKVAWESRQAEAVQQFVLEWEKKNPDPVPPTIQVRVW